MHRGHVILLEKCRKLGKLTVLLNSDESVLRLKNYLAESWETRRDNLLATGLVDRVLSIEDDPTIMIWFLKPDILVAGDDHDYSAIMSRGGKYAGEVITFPYTEGICSTDLYKKSKKE